MNALEIIKYYRQLRAQEVQKNGKKIMKLATIIEKQLKRKK